MTRLIDMSLLPKPDCVIAVDFQAQLTYLLDLYTDGMRSQLDDDTFPSPLPSDPAYQILSTVAYRLGLQNQRTNEACHATMLAYAIGSDLDQLGATFGVQRLTITPENTATTPVIPAVMESDSRFRQRIQMAFEAWTTAGSRGSYEYYVLTASALVLDVFIDRPVFTAEPNADPSIITLQVMHDARLALPQPGDVAVTVLLDNRADPETVNALITASLDTETVIPLTDNPHLLDAEIIEYSVYAILYCYPGPSTEPVITAAQVALEKYVTEHYRLGHDIAVSGLHGAAHQAGVQRVALNIRSDITVQPWQAAKCTGVTVVVGGRDV